MCRVGDCDCIPYFLFSDDHSAYPPYRQWDKLHRSGFDRDLLIYFFVTLFLHALPTTNITTIQYMCITFQAIPFRNCMFRCVTRQTFPLEFGTRLAIASLQREYHSGYAISLAFNHAFRFNPQ